MTTRDMISSVHAGLTHITVPSSVPERHQANSLDTGRDERVTTRVTTQFQEHCKSEVMTGENVIIRPIGSGVAFVQLDDLKTQEQIDRVRPAAFIIHETSPGNRQAWIAVSGVPEG